MSKIPCPACGGTALSPYPDDGGSCPHCFNGEVESPFDDDPLAETELSNDELNDEPND